MSVEVGYFWRWFQGFLVTDNLAVAPAISISSASSAPADPRLPNGGGYTVSDLYNVTPSLFGVTNNYVTFSDTYGDQYAKFNGLDINVERAADERPDDPGRLQRRADDLGQL